MRLRASRAGRAQVRGERCATPTANDCDATQHVSSRERHRWSPALQARLVTSFRRVACQVLSRLERLLRGLYCAGGVCCQSNTERTEVRCIPYTGRGEVPPP